MPNQISIPKAILDAAKADLHAPVVVSYIDEIKRRLGITQNTSPADYPDVVWKTVQMLMEANRPSATSHITSVDSSILGLMLTKEEKAEINYSADNGEQIKRATEILKRRYGSESA